VRQARDAQFTLVGEEHGVAETAQLSAALFKALRPSGYRRMAIELSPIIAQDIETAARRNGLQGILQLFASPDTWSPMYLREEAQFLAAVVAAAPKTERVLWGFDREIFSDRYLISRLEAKVPPRARASYARLKDASTGSAERRAKNPGAEPPFLFAAEPAVAVLLVGAVPGVADAQLACGAPASRRNRCARPGSHSLAGTEGCRARAHRVRRSK